MVGLPLEWEASGQLGGVLALGCCPGTPDMIVGGFAGCSQVCPQPPSRAAFRQGSFSITFAVPHHRVRAGQHCWIIRSAHTNCAVTVMQLQKIV